MKKRIMKVSRQQLKWLKEAAKAESIVPAFIANRQGLSAEYRKRNLELKAKGLLIREDNFVKDGTCYAQYRISKLGKKWLKANA